MKYIKLFLYIHKIFILINNNNNILLFNNNVFHNEI
jgi:hypothetical protein